MDGPGDQGGETEPERSAIRRWLRTADEFLRETGKRGGELESDDAGEREGPARGRRPDDV